MTLIVQLAFSIGSLALKGLVKVSSEQTTGMEGIPGMTLKQIFGSISVITDGFPQNHCPTFPGWRAVPSNTGELKVIVYKLKEKGKIPGFTKKAKGIK